MDFRKIEKLEATTPNCIECHGTTHFIPGTAYRFLKCDNCGQTSPSPSSLTHTIIAAYNFPPKITNQKRIQPCILSV